MCINKIRSERTRKGPEGGVKDKKKIKGRKVSIWNNTETRKGWYYYVIIWMERVGWTKKKGKKREGYSENLSTFLFVWGGDPFTKNVRMDRPTNKDTWVGEGTSLVPLVPTASVRLFIFLHENKRFCNHRGHATAKRKKVCVWLDIWHVTTVRNPEEWTRGVEEAWPSRKKW